MGKKVPDTIIDAMLDVAEGTRIHICSAEPANFAGIAAVELAAATISGVYTAAAGDTSGRKNTLAAQTLIPITASGTANHVVISKLGTTMLVVTTCTSQALVSGGTVDTNAIAHEINAAA